eukprot:TRINITY_DN40226_c0_g1_i1.p1 TRINITY_DN40226_c0_g1~~TRINITY_DN40226_c0_g1_i1.p1  ORF type:complete len:376 (-),score=56.65 TRINITY_DN40226_c0_g1_i1:97-1224(-)
MKSPRPSPNLLVALALALALLRNRKAIQGSLQHLIDAIRRTLSALQLTSNLFTETCNDLQAYLRPSTTRRVQRGRRTPVSARQVLVPTAPRSVRRLLRLLASEDGLAVMYNIAGGAARGVAREMHQTPSCNHVYGDGIQRVVETLASASGQRLVNGAVSTAVREGMQTFLQYQRDCDPQPSAVDWPQKIIDAVLSDRGQAFIVKLTHELTRSVVPILLESGSQARRESSEEPQEALSCTSSSQITPLVKRPLSFTNHEQAQAERTPEILRRESPVTRNLVKNVMQAQGRMGVIERLALLAIRDKELVREVLRTVVAEAVRTYLTTQAELRVYGTTSSGSQHVQQSLWKALMRSAVVDIKRVLLSRGEESTGWVIF